MKHLRSIMMLSVSFILAVGILHAEKYSIDPTHSDINFEVDYLVVSKVQGRFDSFKGELNYDPKNPKTWKVSAEIDAKSINTRNEKRDDHLRNDDFFNVEKFPKITFESTKVVKAKEKSATLKGDLTIRGIKKPVTLNLVIGGITKDPWGNTRAGFQAKTKINRKDFDVKYHKVLETGGLVISDEVEITINVSAILIK